MSGQQACGCNVGRMARVDVYVGHGGEQSGEHHVPLFGGIGIYTHLNRLQRFDDGRKGLESGFETEGYVATFVGSARELE